MYWRTHLLPHEKHHELSENPVENSFAEPLEKPGDIFKNKCENRNEKPCENPNQLHHNNNHQKNIEKHHVKHLEKTYILTYSSNTT